MPKSMKLNDYLFPMLWSPLAASAVTIGVVRGLAFVAGLPDDLSTRAIAFGLSVLVWIILTVSGSVSLVKESK